MTGTISPTIVAELQRYLIAGKFFGQDQADPTSGLYAAMDLAAGERLRAREILQHEAEALATIKVRRGFDKLPREIRSNITKSHERIRNWLDVLPA